MSTINITGKIADKKARERMQRRIDRAPDDIAHVHGTLKCVYCEAEKSAFAQLYDWAECPRQPLMCTSCGRESAWFMRSRDITRVPSRREEEHKV